VLNVVLTLDVNVALTELCCCIVPYVTKVPFVYLVQEDLFDRAPAPSP
jgi:hypothetical protein